MDATANSALVLKSFSGIPEITPGAYELKRAALDAARPVHRVETPEQQLVAVDALKHLKDVRSGMEASRKAVKAPVLDLGRKIDDMAHKFIAEVDKQYGRIQGLINHYQKKQARDAAERQQELEQGQVTAAQLRERAEAFRRQSIRDDDPFITEAKKLEAQALDLEMTAEVAVIPSIDKPRGLVVRSKITFQVIDPIVFIQAWPDFWKVSKNGDHENECLTVDRMKVLDELNREDKKGVFHMTRFPEELSKTEDRRLVQPAGLRVFEETRAHLR